MKSASVKLSVPYHRDSDTKHNTSITKFREQLGLQVYEKKQRACLKCGRLFYSRTPAERLCGCRAW